MADRQCSQSFDPTIEECIAAYHEHTGPLLDGGGEGVIDIRFGGRAQDTKLQPEGDDPISLSVTRRLFGLTRTATRVAVGTSSCASSSRFDTTT
jgi:hypothetical protein